MNILNINIIYNAIICWLKKIINMHLLLQLLTNINNIQILVHNLKCLKENFIDLDLE